MSDGGIESFPLVWPFGKPRTHDRKRARFGQAASDNAAKNAPLTLYVALTRLRDALRLLGAVDVVISTNVATRRDGLPYAGTREPTDPGVAIYFRHDGDPHCLACDRWDRVADNLAAVAAHIDALRGQARWGVGDIRQALAGYRALAAMGETAPWWRVLTFEQPPRESSVVEAKWRQLMAQHHPDVGGHGNQAAEINAAWLEAKRYYANPDR